MKKIIIVTVFLISVIVVSPAISQAQTVDQVAQTLSLQQQMQELTNQLIQMLIAQIAALQAQIATLQAHQAPASQSTPTSSNSTQTTPQTTEPAATTPVIVSQPVSIIPADEYPVIEASATLMTDWSYEGQWKIVWLATQKRHDDNLKCESPEIGHIGTQGITIRKFDPGVHSFTFICTDTIAGTASTKTITFTAE